MHVAPIAAVDKVYDVLRDRDTPADKQTWNRRYREYMNKIKTGDPLEVAAVLREFRETTGVDVPGILARSAAGVR